MNDNSPVCIILNPGYRGINNNYQMLCLFLYVSSILVHTHYTPSLIAVLKTPVGQSWNVTLPFSHNATLSGTPFYMFWCGGNLEHAVKKMTDTAVEENTSSNTYIIRPNFQHKLVSLEFLFEYIPKTAIKQQVLAVKECWSSEKILKI